LSPPWSGVQVTPLEKFRGEAAAGSPTDVKVQAAVTDRAADESKGHGGPRNGSGVRE
jgi:hypothetical protein